MFTLNLMHAESVYQKDKQELDGIVELFSFLLKQKSQSLYAHSLQVANYAAAITTQMGLPHAEVETIRAAGLLHDIGLLMLPSITLRKMPFLTSREQQLYKKHPDLGANMLDSLPACQHILPYIRHHHERWNGTGFPKHLCGVNIPLGARIIAVANYYDNMTGYSHNAIVKTKREALTELFSASGLLFDPSVVRAFVEVIGS